MARTNGLLKVGSTFTGVTHRRRFIPLAKVLDVCPEKGMHTRWFDENGKHYEWFKREEFKSFNVVANPRKVVLCQIQ